LEVAGGTTTFTNGAFSTTLYTGTGNSLSIVNNIDLAGDGGLVWTKRRNSANSNWFLDTERGGTNIIRSNTNEAQFTSSGLEITSFNSNGYTLGTASDINSTSGNDVSWTFKKQAKFFDIVTYTGDGLDDRVLSHSLGSTPGMVIMKRTSSGTAAQGTWFTYHIGAGFSGGLSLNGTESAGYTYGSPITAASNTTVTINNPANNGNINASGATYVAYLFAHDTADDSLIKCGSYTGTAASQSINLGWKPQWLLIRSTGAADWYLLDITRGWTSASLTNKSLQPNNSTAEGTVGNVVYDIAHSSTGFDLASTASQFNASGSTYIYMAIRGDAATDSAITWPTSIKWPAGVAPTTPVPGKKDLFTFLTTDGGTTYYGKKAAEGIA
jgi:hypothetical protein